MFDEFCEEYGGDLKNLIKSFIWGKNPSLAAAFWISEWNLVDFCEVVT